MKNKDTYYNALRILVYIFYEITLKNFMHLIMINFIIHVRFENHPFHPTANLDPNHRGLGALKFHSALNTSLVKN